MQLHQRLVSILGRVRQDVATLVDKEAINTACRGGFARSGPVYGFRGASRSQGSQYQGAGGLGRCNEAPPRSDRRRAECDHFEAAFTIARMPALIASGNSRPAAEVPVVTPSPLAATDSEWPTI